MRKIKNVVIMGAGAMGAAYAAMFTDAIGFTVAFVARGERHERLKNRTFNVNGKLYPIAVVHPDKVTDPADLVLVALKHHHLAGAVADIAALTGPYTTILSVMNGLESEELIGAACGMDKLVRAISVGIDAVQEGDRVTYAQPGKIVFGPMGDDGGGPPLEPIAEALRRAGIDNEVPDDMVRVLWWKFMINVGINQASAVLRAPYGVFQSSADARALMRLLMQEVLDLADKAGVDLTDKDLDQWDRILADLSPKGKTSMLQDVDAARKTEVEVFAGKVVAMGEKYHVPTPVNRTLLHAIKAIESQYLS
jgi:2-dehydropantoate 2-reductase